MAPTTTTTGGEDYTSVRSLHDYLSSLAAGMRINLNATSARRGCVTFLDADRQLDSFAHKDPDEWNALDFELGAPASAASELLALLEPWLDEHGHAAVTLKLLLIELPAPDTVHLPVHPSRLYKDTALNHHLSVGALLSAGAPGDAQQAYAILRKSYGHTVAAPLVVYGVGPLWHTKVELLRLYPGLPQQQDWERLFPPCDSGQLRRCVAGDDELRGEFGTGRSPVERLLKRAKSKTPSGAQTPPPPPPDVPAPAAQSHPVAAPAPAPQPQEPAACQCKCLSA